MKTISTLTWEYFHIEEKYTQFSASTFLLHSLSLPWGSRIKKAHLMAFLKGGKIRFGKIYIFPILIFESCKTVIFYPSHKCCCMLRSIACRHFFLLLNYILKHIHLCIIFFSYKTMFMCCVLVQKAQNNTAL